MLPFPTKPRRDRSPANRARSRRLQPGKRRSRSRFAEWQIYCPTPRTCGRGGRTELYFRVVQEGELAAGDTIDLVEKSNGLAVRQLWNLVLVDNGNVEGARVALRCRTLAPEWPEPLEERVRQADA